MSSPRRTPAASVCPGAPRKGANPNPIVHPTRDDGAPCYFRNGTWVDRMCTQGDNCAWKCMEPLVPEATSRIVQDGMCQLCLYRCSQGIEE